MQRQRETLPKRGRRGRRCGWRAAFDGGLVADSHLAVAAAAARRREVRIAVGAPKEDPRPRAPRPRTASVAAAPAATRSRAVFAATRTEVPRRHWFAPARAK